MTWKQILRINAMEVSQMHCKNIDEAAINLEGEGQIKDDFRVKDDIRC